MMLLRHILPALLWALIILILCAIPGRDIPHISFLELLSFDKFVHASVFFILAYLFIRGLKLQTQNIYLKNQPYILAAIVSITYGGLLEIMQEKMFSERYADILDFIANSIGTIAGAVSFNTLNRKLKNTRLYV